MKATLQESEAFTPHRGARFPKYFLVTVLVLAHVLLVSWMSIHNAPNVDELGHLAAGIRHLRFGEFDLYRVNPPLVRSIAAVPVVFAGVSEDWSRIQTSPHARSEFIVGSDMVEANNTQIFKLIALARFACIPFLIVGIVICNRWANELYGRSSGAIAAALYAFCPQHLAWGASITPDAAASAMGLLASYAFWRWLKSPCWQQAILTGLALGVAELTKSTWVCLFAAWPVLWICHEWLANSAKMIRLHSLQLATILTIGVYVLNAGYGFEESLTPLGEFEFVSKTFGAPDDRHTGNRFRGTFIEKALVPFPANYVKGIDVQKRDFEVGKWSYLHGEQRVGGWWYYYLYGIAVKTPIGTLLLFLLCVGQRAFRHGGVFSCKRQRFSRNRDVSGIACHVVLLAPGLLVLLLVSSQTGFNRHLRYVIPCMPYFFICASGTVHISLFGRKATTLVALLVIASSLESISAFPHSMSFFNIAAGGSNAGGKHLVDSNIDWGQDLIYLRKWIDKNPNARPLYVICTGESYLSPLKLEEFAPPADGKPRHNSFWIAASVNHIRGYKYYSWTTPQYVYLQKLRPVSQIGYSIYIYRVD